MDIVGIICEYNPFHNGHEHHIKQIKSLYPNSLIILVLNGYFLERGEISVLSKENKTKIALEENIDLVVELPFVFGSNSADIFAESAITILNYLNVQKIVFGSESNDLEYLKKVAQCQISDEFNDKLKSHLNKGLNYPTSINKSLDIKLSTPNDLLGVSYLKAIIKNAFNIEAVTIKRTNDFHDNLSNDNIISASNIRGKLIGKESISQYTNYAEKIENVNYDLLFLLTNYKILTDHNLSDYLTVDEGIHNKLIKEVNNAISIDDLIKKIKSKRYTYNRLRRMLTHILIGYKKDDKLRLKIDYIKVLGFNSRGQKHLSTLNKDNVLISRKIPNTFIGQKYELIVSQVYDLLTNSHAYKYELQNKPIIKKH